ncbi:MAG: hypothetical protein ACFFAY_16365, partial [Promethearchaeota archaeon]
WRVVQIRGIWGLFYGILLLAAAYYEYIPFFLDMGPLGPFVFAGFILVTFLILGYIYDRVLVMWAPSSEVTVERNPYQYVPAPKDHIFWFPLYSALLDASEKLADEFDLDKSAIKETREYYAQLQRLRPEMRDDIDKGIGLRQAFIEGHPFADILEEDK